MFSIKTCRLVKISNYSPFSYSARPRGPGTWVPFSCRDPHQRDLAPHPTGWLVYRCHRNHTCSTGRHMASLLPCKKEDTMVWLENKNNLQQMSWRRFTPILQSWSLGFNTVLDIHMKVLGQYLSCSCSVWHHANSKAWAVLWFWWRFLAGDLCWSRSLAMLMSPFTTVPSHFKTHRVLHRKLSQKKMKEGSCSN